MRIARDAFGGLSSAFARKAVWALVVRLATVGLSFLLTLLISRRLALDVAGEFFFLFAGVQMIERLTRGGLPRIAVRSVAQTAHAKAALSSTLARVAGVAAILAVVAALVASVFAGVQNTVAPSTGLIISVALLTAFMSLTPTIAYMVRGMDDLTGGVGLERTPFYALAITLLASFPNVNSTLGIVWLLAGAAAAAVGIGAAWTRVRYRRVTERTYVEPDASDSGEAPPIRAVLQGTATLGVMVAVQAVAQNAPQFALGVTGQQEATALFAVANRIALLTLLLLNAVNAVVAPRFAVLARQGAARRLRRLYAKSVGLTAIATLPVVGVLWFFPAWTLSLFGESYLAAVPLLRILLLGQLVNAMTGPVNTLLVMAGEDRLVTGISIVVGAATIAGIAIAVWAGGLIAVAWTAAGSRALLSISMLLATTRLLRDERDVVAS